METTIQKTKTYQRLLGEKETEKAISTIKNYFTQALSKKLNLFKVEAPLLVEYGTGINDDLNGIEKPVKVHVKDITSSEVEIVHSLAKWKRYKLGKLEIDHGEGIYTDMRALRPDEDLSEIHSVYVDQWDWEKVILESNRSIVYLKKTVQDIYSAILETEKIVYSIYPDIKPVLPEEITFIHTEELLTRYPDLNPKQRESKIAKSKGAVFIIGIGGKLSDGKPHDGRAPDYDDWTTETISGRKGLNGDIILWNPVLESAFEISSMGIRVSPDSLQHQLFLTGNEDRLQYKWHQELIAGKLPYTIGGGIGQSRLVMFLLRKAHIGEVQNSIWPSDLRKELLTRKINLLS